jgi:phosphatidylglycerophosphate synthase
MKLLMPGLHRSGKKADWATRSRRRWSVWQKIASGSGGVLTPGNLITLVGFGLVVLGLVMVIKEHYLVAFLMIVAGRSCDLLDGWLAERTHTKSPLGEVLDSTFDKLGTGLGLVVLTVVGIVPLIATLAILVPQLIIGGLSLVQLLRGSRLHPTRLGKISMALAWFGLGFFVLNRAFGWSETSVLGLFSYANCLASSALAAKVVTVYARRVLS